MTSARYFGGFSAKEEPEVEVPVSSSSAVPDMDRNGRWWLFVPQK